MRAIKGVLLGTMFMCSCLAFVGGAHAADIRDEVSVAPLPKGMLAAFAPGGQEEGQRFLEEDKKSSWVLGFPVAQKTRTVRAMVDSLQGQQSAHIVFAGEPITESSWSMTAALAVIVAGVAAISIRSQKNNADDIRLFAFYAGILDIVMAIIIADAFAGTVMSSVVVAFAIFIAVALMNTLDFAMAVVIVATFAAAVPFMYLEQGVDYLKFMGLVIAGSYLLAKLAKRFFWKRLVAARVGE